MSAVVRDFGTAGTSPALRRGCGSGVVGAAAASGTDVGSATRVERAPCAPRISQTAPARTASAATTPAAATRRCRPRRRRSCWCRSRRRINSIVCWSSRSSSGSVAGDAGSDDGGNGSVASGEDSDDGDGVSPPAHGVTRAPQPGQNRASGGGTELHRGHRDARNPPQAMQNLAPARAPCPHVGQLMSGRLLIADPIVNCTNCRRSVER